MGSIHSRAGAEIEVSVPVRIKHGVQAGPVGHTNRSWRESLMEIGIIRGINLQVFIKNPVKGIPETEGYSRISLQTHPLVETVKVHPGD